MESLNIQEYLHTYGIESAKIELYSQYNIKNKINDELGLTLFYTEYDEFNENPFVNQWNGIISDIDGNVVCRNFPKIKRFTNINDLPILENFKVHTLLDGTLLRLYYYQDEWRYSTNRCIDASKTKYTSYKSFKQLFDESAMLMDYSKLNTEYTYVFMICHPENKIVVQYVYPQLYHIGTIDKNDQKVNDIVYLNERVVPKPTEYELPNMKAFETLLNKTNKNVIEIAGYIINDSIQLLEEKYNKAHSLRNNAQNLITRYFELKKETPGQLPEFYKFFPEAKKVPIAFRKLVNNIYTEYVNTYILKNGYTLKTHFQVILKIIHSFYLMSGNKTNIHTVYNHVLNMNNQQITWMIHHECNLYI